MKEKLLSIFELSIFMVDGFNRFKSDKKDFLHSFGVAFISIPFFILSVPYLRAFEPNLMELTLTTAIILMVTKYFLSMAALILFVYYICKIMKKKSRFYKTITVMNWMTLIPLILTLPFLALMMSGLYTYEQSYPMLVVITLYAYALTAFIIRYVIDIPWELSVFLAICTMAINQFFYEVYLDIANFI